ncbi:MAG: hypothetical protein NZ700_03625 [Gemmataceae bacterium]|nr:hypothetical protein [Gemmataceae bacterium]MDW8263757.1 hypothetical protein [Gemmataceae bacterium]
MPDEPSDSLVGQALLYVSGELDPGQEAAFERLVESDQAAREALCQAVALSGALAGRPVVPNPAYRQKVRERLLRARTAHRGKGHRSAAWALVGAVAAAVVWVVLRPTGPPGPEAPEQPPVVATPSPEPQEAVAEDDHSLDVANLWVEMSEPTHLEKACDEEARRKARAADWPRLSRGDDPKASSGLPAEQAAIED